LSTNNYNTNCPITPVLESVIEGYTHAGNPSSTTNTVSPVWTQGNTYCI